MVDAVFQVPVLQRGGSVVCRWMGRGSCTAEFQQLPLSVTVALNAQVRIGKLRTPGSLSKNPFSLQGAADGQLYLDDGHSFSYRDRKAFCLRRFRMQSGCLVCW